MRHRANTSKFGKQAGSAEELQAALQERLPRGCTRDEVVEWLRGEQIDFSDDGDALQFTLPGPARGLFVGVSWMVTILLTNDRLADLVVEQGLTGP